MPSAPELRKRGQDRTIPSLLRKPLRDGGKEISRIIIIKKHDGYEKSSCVRSGSGNVKGSGNDDNSTSAGGNTSLGGFGGVITTGNAKAKSKVSNNVNSTDIKVKTECGCDDDVDVHVKNKRTDVTNDVGTLADTGFNDANGGSADATVTKSGSVKGTDNDTNTTSAGDNLSIGGDRSEE